MLISQLQEELKKCRQGSPVKEAEQKSSFVGAVSSNVMQKIADIQAKYAVFMETQNKIGKKIN